LLFVDLDEQSEEGFTRCCIDIARRFIGKNNVEFQQQLPRYSNALLLSARKFDGFMVASV
jgi:hypothetical protein